MALAKIGCEKAEALYVGDRDEAEIRPAHEVGLRTILLARNKPKDEVKWADLVINNLSELEEAIDSL
jgi:FMN phosphatase YigB (HAD superfamily)